ncbi:MAG: pseudouridine synthase [Pseudomonadota bacterium]
MKPVNKTDQEPMRVAKAIARSGLCSRRDAEKWIEQGRVKLNNSVLTTPAYVLKSGDELKVDDKVLPQMAELQVWCYHKPRGLVTTHKDPEGRPTVFQTLDASLPRVVSVGRLDINTEGLLLLTTRGDFARHLELPSSKWIRKYRVRAKGRITQDKLGELGRGITVDGIKYGAISAEFERQQGANCWLNVSLKEGKNREIKKVLSFLGLEVNRLIRVSYGPFSLGNLEVGRLTEVKKRVLRSFLGEKLFKNFQS